MRGSRTRTRGVATAALACAVVCVLCAAWPAAAAGPGAAPGAAEPIDMAQLLAFRTPGDPQVSSDGLRVAFTLATADTIESRTRIDLFVMPVDGSSDPVPFVSGPENETSPRWSPDGRWLAFVMTRGAGARSDGSAFDVGKDGARRQVWIAPATGANAPGSDATTGGEPRALTLAPEGIDSYRWTPDGRSVVYVTRRALPHDEAERRAALRKRRIDGVVEGQLPSPCEFWMQRVGDAAPRRLLTADPGVDDWDLSDDGRTIVYATNGTGSPDDESRFNLWIFSVRDPAARQLTFRGGPETKPAFSPDGAWVAFQADQDTTVTFSQEEIFVIPAAGGALYCVTSGIDVPATSPVWDRPGQLLWMELAKGVDNELFRLRFDNPETVGAGVNRFDGGGTFQTELSVSPDRHVKTWIGEDASSWAEVYVTSPITGLHHTTLNAGFHSRVLPDVRDFSWHAPDGLPIEGLLVVPPEGAGRAPYPAIAYPHGGPYNRSTRRPRGLPTSFVLASRGFLVLEPNYRGSRGYSESFGQANRNDLGGGDLGDILSGLDTLVARGLADSSRLGITGGSYGGYLVNWAIANTSRFRAAVTYYGISNFITDFSIGSAPSYEREYLGSYYWEDFGAYWNRSPISRVAAIRTPLLILHGEEDPKTSIANAWEMWTALRTLKRPVEFVHYPREGHGFAEPNHRIDAARRTVLWFEKYLGTRDR